MGKKKITDGNITKDLNVDDKFFIDEQSKPLRQLAEKKLLERDGIHKELSFEESKQVLHELQVHQIELEIQNEELRQAQLALDESREKYYALYNFAPVGYVSLDENGIILESNLTASNLLGIAKTELVNSPFTNFIFKEDQDIFYLSRKRLIETEKNQQFELRIIKYDNTYFWAHVDAVFSKKVNGNVITLITITDISKLKLNEETLQENEKRYKTLFETAAEGILIANIKNQEFKYSNPSMSRMLGYSEIEFRKMSVKDIHPKELFEHIVAEFVAQAKGKKTLASEIPCLKKDGSILYADINTSKAVIDGIECNVGFFTDVTERKQIEKALRESELFLKETQIIAHLGIYTMDIISDKWSSSEILDNIFGIDSDFDKSTKGWTSIIHPEWQKKMTDYFIQEVVGKGIKFDKEYKIIRQNDKAERWVHGIGELKFNDMNQPITMIGTIQDITESKRTEEEIRLKNEELIKLNVEKDKFFSIIAHDLRSPFTGFLGWTDMLKTDLHNMTIKELQEIANHLNKSANRLFGLLTNLLEWSMMQRGLTAFNPVKLSLKDIVKGTIKIFKDAAKIKEIKIEEEISDDIFVNADESMLKTILRNLVSNAIKFTNKGGHITITAKELKEKIEISVKDTGIGMNKDLINDLFKIDRQTNRKGTDGEPSSGLGLILCKEYVEKHNGNITVMSEEDKGSKFIISLPVE